MIKIGGGVSVDINLTIYDMDNFLDKYTRFMTKDIYISNKMYSKFLEQYNYLFKTLEKDSFLYEDNKQYKKVIDIIDKRRDLLRLHNKKYLTSALKTYQDSFNLNEREKEIVLTEEENTYVVGAKNRDSLVVSKLDFLIRYKNYKEDNILILTTTEEEANTIRKLGINIDTYAIKEYGMKVIDNKVLLNDNDKYDYLIKYIMNNLFKDKTKFNSFYEAFSKYIYLNKDYKDYDTFKDYHNYMYKRKYLASNLSLKKFNEKEISKRKTYLRTINNENLKEKQEVDIANFLYLNSIIYSYDYDKAIFKLLDKDINIKFVKGLSKKENTYKDKTIYLYSSYDDGKTYLEVLAYNLIKYMYPMEKIDDNEVYTKLCSTNIDNYFSEFIIKYLIPLINYYEEFNNLDDIDLDENAKKEFLNIYKVYAKYLEDNNLIEESYLFKIIEEKIISSKYKYLFLIGDIPINVNMPTLTIVDEYREIELIKDNIKLLYDYKKYLYENQSIPVINTFLGKEEISILTKKFLKDNLKIINKYLEENMKKIKVTQYDDSNRLHVYQNISGCCFDILKECDKSIIALRDLKDVSIFNSNRRFSKLDKNTLMVEDNIINVDEILKIDKIYDNIILPYLIKDNYHNELFKRDYQYNIKVMLYVALSKCRHNLIILVPSSGIEELNKLLGINN